MSANKTTDTIVEDFTAEDFAKAYEELVVKMGHKIVVTPAYTVTNHGSFELVLQYSVGKIPNSK